MWFIFPQVEDMSRSPTTRFYAFAGQDDPPSPACDIRHTGA
ncbi:DUF1810 family protein [Caulobacter sp. CCNWLY153]